MDEISRGHLNDPEDGSVTIYRRDPSASLRNWLQVFWIPVWSVPESGFREQRVLTHPVCLLSITDSYARLVGPASVAARQVLRGDGWAFGVMFRPGVGRRLLGRDVSAITDGYADLSEIALLHGLAEKIRNLMQADPRSADAHRAAQDVVEGRVASLGHPDDGAVLAGRVVSMVEDPLIASVADLCEALDLPERKLQRLCSGFLGVSPRWLIRQRRLHEAGERLRNGGSLADLATRLGYTDQSHFSRDFRAATGWPPGLFARMAKGMPGEVR
ncbi:helix-turn-helix domain-containing protein [Arthrobacter caoxuetaonis]|uniref:AraC family transcriptional regulator n=1 Tax=Arthrobacter caoxuetaonis TaxID=2886935 RepID=A0A9X1MAZ1_9MICC|nr:AraC family transcriptional regulator [Arthrobacter caoxuetaonis]MCC3296191.1 AraC family transcriptional regulator [Arthrobacter caoxuetaonis]USQ56952.1 AraC family transcriptional regulator [Arthrobacter caoxuetaonis]